MKLLHSLLLGLALVFVAAPTFASAQDASLEELSKKIDSERDDAEPEVLRQMAEVGTRDAALAVIDAYGKFGSLYMRREALRVLGSFDEVDDAFEPALLHLANVVTNERARELRTAALETLGDARKNARPFLMKIVESATEDHYRERALELHIRMGGAGDADWYKKVFERDMAAAQKELAAAADIDKKKKRGKDEDEAPAEKKEFAWPSGKLRAAALRAIARDMEEKDLVQILEKDRSLSVVTAALEELDKRGSKKALGQARQIAEQVGIPGSLRSLAAEIVLKAEGAKVARDMIDLALKNTTPIETQNRIADLVAEIDDDKVKKEIGKLVGKGKGQERLFGIRAAKKLDDEKLVKKLRKDIKNRDSKIAVATIQNLASRRDRESIEDLEKNLEKTKDDDVRQAILEALSAMYDGENAWVERLVGYTSADDVDLRNAALNELGRLGRDKHMDLFVQRLSHADWSTRYTALKALERLREPQAVSAIIARMPEETGRMAREFADTLFNLTGESFGKNAAIWSRWLANLEGDVEIISERDLEARIVENEERRLKQLTNAEFFGLRIESHRALFIIDVSGSMNEPMRARYAHEQGDPRIETAKEELSKAIKALEDGALFNIFTFSSGVESWLEKGVMDSNGKSREEALEYVSRLGALGGTNLYGALALAFQDEDVDTIFVLSDGEPSVGDIIDPQLIREAIAEMNRTRGVVINTIAIGGTFKVLEWLAEDSGGEHVSLQ